ncbi:restriction endonuclease subunit S [Streptomyces sp. S1]|uniref:restriction endonuclease subunit S n=1 Tax=Streptomyces sp. S1 TaxID=718288 RepID=UPI000EF80A00|nr:restriction endonuclease subunit S [Streptomyces sp. S1]
MSDQWQRLKLESIADVIMGQSPPSDTVMDIHDSSTGLPFLQGNAEFGATHPNPKLSCSRPLQVAQAGDSLISVRAPVGQINRADQSYVIGRGLAAVRFRSMDKRLGARLLESAVSQLSRVAQGSTFEAVSKSDIASMIVDIPPLAEQRQITEILDTIDEQISVAGREISKTRAARDGAVSSALHKASSAVRWQKVADEFELSAGITLGPHRVPSSRPHSYLRVANVQRGRIDLTDVAKLEATPSDLDRWALKEGDLLVVEGHANPDEIGRCARVLASAVGLLHQNHLFRLRARNVMPEFGELWLNSRFARDYWRRMCATSSGLYTVNSKMLARLGFPACDPGSQLQIVQLADRFNECLQANQSELERLQMFKKSLMDDLLRGRVRVPVGNKG